MADTEHRTGKKRQMEIENEAFQLFFGETKMGGIFQALFDKAIDGDIPAIREILDRKLGKPIQQVDMTSNGESIFAGSQIIHTTISSEEYTGSSDSKATDSV